MRRRSAVVNSLLAERQADPPVPRPRQGRPRRPGDPAWADSRSRERAGAKTLRLVESSRRAIAHSRLAMAEIAAIGSQGQAPIVESRRILLKVRDSATDRGQRAA